MQRLWGLLGVAGGPQPEWEVAGRRLREEAPISEGGFAFVVQARDLDTGEVFALKKIICQDADGLQSAKHEVEALENLPSHKNIVGYFGHAILEKGTGGCPHIQVLILLELCPRGTLLNMLERHNGVLPEEELMRALTDLSEAIFCLHSHSPPLMHRDLKLENVLQGEDGFWKVIDFGSWCSNTMDLTDVSTKELGRLAEEVCRHTTMMYRPPEMADVYLRFPVTCAVDIWMVGCIVFTLLYNRHPFQEASALAIREARYTLPPRTPPPSAKLIDLLIWLLAPDPRHRPSARKLVMTLWQWEELQELVLPESLQAQRARLLAAGGGGGNSPKSAAVNAPPVRRKANVGYQPAGPVVRPPSLTEAPTQADKDSTLAPRPQPVANGKSPGDVAALMAATAAAAASSEPWTASFADFGEAGAREGAGGTSAEEPPTVGSVPEGNASDEDWGFQGFQSSAAAQGAVARTSNTVLDAPSASAGACQGCAGAASAVQPEEAKPDPTSESLQ